MTDKGDLTQVEIFGERYTLRGLGGEDVAYTKRVAHFVDQQIHEVEAPRAALERLSMGARVEVGLLIVVAITAVYAIQPLGVVVAGVFMAVDAVHILVH